MRSGKALASILAVVWIAWGGLSLLLVATMMTRYGIDRIAAEPVLRWTALVALVYTGLLPIAAGNLILARKAVGWWLMMALSTTEVFYWLRLFVLPNGGKQFLLFFVLLDLASIAVLIVIGAPRRAGIAECS